MKGLLALWAVAAASGLTVASPAAEAKCNADACARAITGTSLASASRSVRLADCSSFLSFTAVPSIPTVTRTVTPTATTTVFKATVTQTHSILSGSAWPTTINTEVYQNNKRGGEACAYTSTISPTALPTYATSACSAAARFSSACSCAGVTARYTSYGCYTAQTTVTAPPKATITQFATSTVDKYVYYTQTFSTALVNEIRCGQIVPIDEDLPAYKIVCEAQGTGNRTLLETVQNTDWDNCVDRATFGRSADDWEFDLVKNTCYIYDPYSPGLNRNVTTPRSKYVYAYIYNGS